jgi:hypothetical protein
MNMVTCFRLSKTYVLAYFPFLHVSRLYPLRYLCTYHPIKGARELAAWVDSVLAVSDDWLRRENVNPSTGEVEIQAVVHAFRQEQRWLEPNEQQAHSGNKRVLLVQAMRYQAGLRRLREHALARRRRSGRASPP